MADTLLLPAVTRVAIKAADELVQSVTRIWGVDTDRGNLEQLLLAVQCMLPDAEVKGETSPVFRRCMKELKAVAYQADDVLDNLQYEALRREANEGEPMARKVTRCLSLHSPLLFRLTVSRNLIKVLRKLDGLVLEMHTLGLVELPVARHALCQQTQVVMNGSDAIFGRDDDEEVVKLLLDQKRQDQKNVQVLPIIGMGGVGKTTLAKMVYNDHRIQKHFDLKMWHCVSEKFEATSVVRSIIELATGERCDLPDANKFWRARLQGVIGMKRFLLILDNVRNEGQHK